MLIGGSRREQVLFAGVMKELLAPINNPRYVIIGKEWGVRTYGVSFPCRPYLPAASRTPKYCAGSWTAA